MSSPFPNGIEYLVFTANKNLFGVPHHEVISVMDVPEITHVPKLPPEIRGIVLFREENIPLFDLRVCFNTIPRAQQTRELVENLAQRRQDHVNWLRTLEKEVHDNHPITVQTDPHLCAFGKWYDRFEADNLNLRNYMKLFDVPHKAIHAIAVEAKQLVSQGNVEAANALIKKAEAETLSRLLSLFDGIGDLVGKYLKEYMVVFDTGLRPFAVAVDDINFFSPLHHIEHPLPRGLRGSGVDDKKDIVQAISHNSSVDGGENRGSVLLLDVGRLLEQQPTALHF